MIYDVEFKEGVNELQTKCKQQGYNALEIKASYSKGGYSYYDGQTQSSGLMVHFRPMETKPSEHGFSCSSYVMFDDNAFKIKAFDMARDNKKKVQKVNELINAHKDKFIELYMGNKKNELIDFVAVAFL